MGHSTFHTRRAMNTAVRLERENIAAEMEALRRRLAEAEDNSALLRGIAMAFAISAGVGCMVFAVLWRIGVI